MKGMYDFLVEPLGGRTNNTKDVADKKLLLNTELQNHSYVNRVGVVITEPLENNTNIKVGDKVVVHHNVFRRFRDIRGKEKNSRSYYKENLYFVSLDQIYGYFEGDCACNIKALPGFNFVVPIKEDKMFSINFEKPLVGVLYIKDPNINFVEEGDLIGFSPNSEYEFTINGGRAYRVPTNSITIKYEYQGNEEEYHPSWTQSG